MSLMDMTVGQLLGDVATGLAILVAVVVLILIACAGIATLGRDSAHDN